MIQELEDAGLSYDKLTQKQQLYFKQHIWNGVGSREFFINPHDLIFKLPSLYHDFYYWRGGTDEHRIMSDKDFFHRCHGEVRKQKKIKKLFYFPVSYIYFAFLKMLGKVAFEYRDSPCQTWEELLERVYRYYDNNPKLERPPKYY